MLGCHDFCGYYDWTFAYIRERFGAAAVERLWAEAIGGESQSAYLSAATCAGLQGLHEIWTKTGQDEQCDWTFTLDEARNVLRWDMRQCPSKGFLLENNLHADEDYCNHCMGWIAPLLAEAGIEVAAHEHNHCGQCWAEMRVRGQAYEPLDLPIDIRRDKRWRCGHLDRFEGKSWSERGSVERICEWFTRSAGRAVLGDAQFVAGAPTAARFAVVLSDDETLLRQAGDKLKTIQSDNWPLLLHAFPPICPPIDFAAMGLPRPIPLLPLLIRAGVYRHQLDAATALTSGGLATLASAAMARLCGLPETPRLSQ